MCAPGDIAIVQEDCESIILRVSTITATVWSDAKAVQKGGHSL
jgi:hypothetical protein